MAVTTVGNHCRYSHFCGIIIYYNQTSIFDMDRLVINGSFSVGIKVYQDRNAIEVILRGRKLKFTKQGLDKALLYNNYFNLFNGLETLLLPNKNIKHYNGESLDDFIDMYNFDKNLSSQIFYLIISLEDKLKNSIAHHFSQKHCCTIDSTMEYLNPQNYIDPTSRPNYPFQNYQNKSIYNQFSRFNLFEQGFLTKLVNFNDHIDANFYRDSSYGLTNSVRNTSPYYRNYNNQSRSYSDPDYDVAVPFWVSIETFDFGTILRLLHYLQDDVLDCVMKDFGIGIRHRAEFLNMLDFIKELRNHCAHGSLISRFRTPKYMKINGNLIRVFNLSPVYHNTSNSSTPASVIKLFDVLKLLSFFVDTKPIYKQLQKIIYRNNKKFRGHYDLNERLLERMGEKQLAVWKRYLYKKVNFQF